MKSLLEFLNENDRFAAFAGMALTYVDASLAKAEMVVQEHHLNGGGVCQGGALFTLADLALAAVMNACGQLTFGIENNITFVRSARLGDRLVATATLTKDHKKLPYCLVEVCNEAGELLAHMTALGYRKADEVKFDTWM